MIEDFWELILQADSRASCASTNLDLLATLAITRIAQIQSAKSWIAQLFQNGQWKDRNFGMKKSTLTPLRDLWLDQTYLFWQVTQSKSESSLMSLRL